MKPVLGVLHTAVGNVTLFQELCRELLPDVDCFQMLDESLLGNTIAAGALTPATTRRVLGHVTSAVEAGATHVLVTCSSIGAAAELARNVVTAPVIRIDQAMVDQAVRTGRRIGVIGTVQTTMGPTADLVKRRAALAGSDISLTTHVCDGAFAALARGDTAAHDQAVADGLTRLANEVDVIILAQASMARVADALPERERAVPFLSSPRSGMEYVKSVIQSSAV
ncbi:MAG: aspartate/glutamate racemase family protein [Dehalococcoidia bacterium]